MATTALPTTNKPPFDDEDGKKRVRDLAAKWLEAEKVWQSNFRTRVVLAVLVLPVYYVYMLGVTIVNLVLITIAIIFAIFMCFIVCFRLDNCVRRCCRAMNGDPAKPKKDASSPPAADVEAGQGVPAIKANEDIQEDHEVQDQFGNLGVLRLQRYMFEAQIWAKLVLANPGRFLVRERLRALEEESAQFILERSSHTYLLPRETVLQLESWPKHEHALAQGLLLRTPINALKPPQTGARILNPVLFVSHKWVGNLCDDEKNQVLTKVKERLAKTPKTYVWFDYSCVPQDDDKERMLHLRSIPEVLNRCEVGAIVHDDMAMVEKYLQSVWCQLEFIMSGLNMKKLDVERTWTIYDPNDLYLILPAFINMTCKTQNFSEMFGGVRQRGGHTLFAQILRFFIAWHDKTHPSTTG